MKINYQLTNSDFLEYQLYTSSKSTIHKKRRFKTRVFTPVIYFLFGLYLANKNEDNGIGIVFTFVSILWFIFYPSYSKWRYKKHFKKNVEETYKNIINKTVEIELNDSHLNTKDFTSESRVNGSELKELIETRNHFFIKLTSNLSLIVPKHSIKNQKEFKKNVIELGAEYVNELDWKWK